jgi:hypothetical protein
MNAQQYAVIRPGIDYEIFARWLEIVQQSIDGGFILSMPPAAIMALEDAGAVVDLRSGQIEWPNGVAAPPQPMEEA